MRRYKLADIAPIKQAICENLKKQVWFLNLDMVESNTGRVIDYLYVDKDEVGASTVSFDCNNVLYSKLRPYLNKVVLPDRCGVATSEMLPLMPDTSIITREYLTYFLRSRGFVEYINSKTAGAKMPRANMNDLKAVDVPCPSINEQKTITRTFDQVISIIEFRQKQLAALDTLIKARFVEMFGDYHTNSKGFESHKGSVLFKFSSGKFLPEEKRLEEGIPVYGGNGIAWHTEEPLVDYPTIIIGRVGAWCGNVHTVVEPVWITDNAIYIKEQKTNKFTLEFLSEMMKIMDFHQYADFSGQPKITQKPLENLDYLTPPIEMQNEFTTFCKQVDKSKLAEYNAIWQLNRFSHLQDCKAA